MYEIKHRIFFGIRHDDLILERIYLISGDFLPRAGEHLEMGVNNAVEISHVSWVEVKDKAGRICLSPIFSTHSGRDGMEPEYYESFGYVKVENES